MGRPRKADQVRVNWDYVGRAMVYGEVARHEDGREDELVWPSRRKFAARLGCAKSTLDNRAKKRGWQERRAETLREYGKAKLLEMARRDGRLWPIAGEPEPGLHLMAGDQSPAKKKKKKTKKRTTTKPKPTPDIDLREVDTIPIQTDQIEFLLVHGEVKECTAGAFQVRYPTHGELAERYSIGITRIATIAKNGNTLQRRKEAQERFRMMVDDSIVEARVDAAEAYHETIKSIVHMYVERFKENLIAGSVVADSVMDLDRIVKLGELLDGGATARTDISGMPSLSELSADYLKLRDGEQAHDYNVAADMDDPTTGFVQVH